MRWDVGIDLGTENVRLADRKAGLVLDERAALAFREGRDAPAYAGDLASRIAGRVGENLSVERPLRDGTLENGFIADRTFRWVYRRMQAVSKKRRFTALVTCAPFARPVQRDTLLSAALDAGAAAVSLIRSDAASALGAGLDLNSPEAKMVVDLGAGKVTVTVFTFGRVAAFAHIPYGLNRIDDRIRQAVRVENGYRISAESAREIKHTLGSALPRSAPLDVIMHMTGFSLFDSLPHHFDVETEPVLAACEDVVREVVRACETVMESLPEELTADLNDAGAVLTGGGAEMTGLNKRIGDALGLPCRVADVPAECAVRGLLRALHDPACCPEGMLVDQKVSDAWR